MRGNLWHMKEKMKQNTKICMTFLSNNFPLLFFVSHKPILCKSFFRAFLTHYFQRGNWSSMLQMLYCVLLIVNVTVVDRKPIVRWGRSACKAGQQCAGLKAHWVKWPKANIDHLIYCESITHTQQWGTGKLCEGV